MDTYVTILDLLAHANYTFEVEAVNGVSDLSRTQRLFAAVSIATGQAGKDSYTQHLQEMNHFDLHLESYSAVVLCEVKVLFELQLV